MIEDKTQTYYNQNHKELIKRYNSATLTPLHRLFNQHIQKSDKVIEIGFGSGRDLKYIQALGAECWGIDSTQGFVDTLAKESYFKKRLFCAKLPILDLELEVKFDVIVCIAVIMHLTKEEIRVWAEDVKNYLAIGGKIILSYSITPREDDERFFEDLRDGVVQDIFLDARFRLVDEVCSEDVLNREIKWRSEIYEL
ncbi:hypothetical protein MNB_SV-12-1194 [hydrothermal vent metagenome]|uniref:Methyltransferase type 12 domain-containing protein n=1 Tax=hydrothermal vent metagenome TaxID=652676 RepID=A0A1W1BSP0_9ZZZZ